MAVVMGTSVFKYASCLGVRECGVFRGFFTCSSIHLAEVCLGFRRSSGFVISGIYIRLFSPSLSVHPCLHWSLSYYVIEYVDGYIG